MQGQLLEGYRLSPQQRAAWRTRRDIALECRVRITGPLDEQRLRAALRQVVARHQILRSKFCAVVGLDYPLQQIHEEASPELVDFVFEQHAGTLRIKLSPLCSDPATLAILVAELRAIYHGAELPDEPLQYIQFAEWMNELSGEEGVAEGRQFWEERKAPASPTLPGELRAGAGNMARIERSIDGRALLTLAERLAVTLASLLLGALAAQLWRRTGEAHLAIFNLFPCRKFPELQGAMGPFARFLPVPGGMRTGIDFEELVRKIARELQESEKWEEFYGEELHDSGFGFEYREESGTAGNWRVEELHTWTENLKLKLVCERQGESIRIALWYDEARYQRRRMEWLLEGLEATLRSASPRRRVRELEIMGADERRTIEGWSWGGAAREEEGTIWERFSQVAGEMPDRIALVAGEEQISYRELHRRAQQLGARLRAEGVKPEEVVGLSMERSAEQLIAMLGILASGGAYTPLDVEWPSARKEQVKRELGLRVVVSWVEGESERQEEAPRQTGEQLAYALYTSGSTGRAKGVMVRQSSVLHLWQALRERVYQGAGEGQRIGLNASLSFDASVKQWVQWLSGERIEVVPEEVRGDGEKMREWLRERGIEWVDATPSQWHLVEQAGRVETRVLLGGEAVPESLWREVAGGWNVYGPTECTVDASAGRIEGSGVTIGRPLRGVRIYILDEEGRLAPAGVRGEICIGGTGLGRGYAKQGGWTAEAWRPDGVSGEAGARLYHSGDIGWFDIEGALHCEGREDGQVKLRGYRVELGEVEGILREHAWVREAAVAVRGERLVGYVSLEGGGEGGRVRHSLRNGLEIVAQSRGEAEVLYEEIFAEGSYGRHGIEVPEDGVVIDAGANIGMFTMWVCEQSRGVRVWAIEPIGEVAGTLRRNVARYGERVKVVREGVGKEERWERFTYYRGAPALSGMSRYAGARGEREVVEGLVGEGVESEEQVVRVRSLGALLREEGLERVDLLKMDVQGAEWEAVEGMGPEEWGKIRQIVMEVHGEVERMVEVLERAGYATEWEVDERAGSRRYKVYARRGETEGHVAELKSREVSGSVEEALRRHVKERAPEYMVPATIVVLDRLPLTRSGKVDRQALPEPRAMEEREEEGYRSQTEEIVGGIWREVLGVEKVGRKENFFELGGHSLLATQVMARVRKTLGVELALRALFEAPTVAELSRRAEEAGVGEPEGELRRVGREAPLPASYGQQRLWFLQQMEPESAYYNCPGAVRLRGALREGALEQSLRAIVERHEVLRTRYRMEDGELRQEVGSGAEFVLEREELSGPLEDRLAAEARKPFDLGRDLPIRALLVKVGEQEWVLALTLHHIAADGWSMGVLLKELNAGYRGERMAGLPLQYGDYAVWERGRKWERSLEYWKERLQGMSPSLELAADRVRPAVRSYAGGRERQELSAELSAGIGELSRRYGASEYMTMLAGLMVVLWRYSGQGDVAVGTVVGGRERAELEGLIGLFINTVVVRVDVAGEGRFGELVGRVKEEVLEGQRHGRVPFERVVEAVMPERSMRQGPLVQVMFLYEGRSGQEGELRLGGVECEGLAVETGTAKFDVTLGVSRIGEKLEAVWEYSEELWDGVSARRMLESWERVMESAVSAPEQQLRELSWVGEEERRKVVEEWNGTEAGIAGESNVVWWVERQAAERPDAVAVEGEWGEQVSYGELNRRANGLARVLRRSEIEREERVGVCVERGVGMVVGLLGVLKAGGAYVPLEVAQPGVRLQWMLGDTGARVAVTDEAGEAALGDWEGIRVRAEQPGEDANVGERIEGEQLAYIIYTSGSTGQPKGVAVPHKAIVRLVCNTNYVQFTPSSTLAQIGSFGFDALTFELWGPLSHGGRVVVLSKDTIVAPKQLAAAFRRCHVDTLFITTALFNQVAQEEPSTFGTLSTVIVGGETLDPDWVRAILEMGPPVRLLQAYGPTENTTFTTCGVIETVAPGTLSIPIGRPISNTQTYVLDDNLDPLPAGLEGWLFTAGDGLARGYTNRSDLTAAGFLPNPFSRTSGARMYRTGDRARYLADGRLQFLGRRDDQIKLRGHRIELGEIQAIVRACPGVLDAIVVLREDSPGDKYLAAYITGDATSVAVRAHLRTRVPDYMIPAAIERLAQFPLTANGKVDRAALPEPGRGVSKNAGFAAPAPGIEEALAALWLQLLPVETVGAHDNFFEIGGHSLLAVRLVSRIRAAFHTDLPLRAIFEHPTVSGLAPVIRESIQTGSHRLTMEVLSAEQRSRTPLSFAQQRLWFLSQFEPDDPTYICTIGLHLQGELNEAALAASLRQLMDRHEALRTRFVNANGTPWQVVDPSATLRMHRRDLSGEDELATHLAEEASQPFDLEHGPPLRARLLRLGAREHALLVSLHHIVCDGWSLDVFARDWSELYSAACQGRAAYLPALPVQYADYAAWQRQWLRGAELDRQMGYWRERLMGAEPLELPTDRTRPIQLGHSGGRVAVEVAPGLREELEQLSRRRGVTLFTTLLAAFQVLLHRYSGQDAISVGTPVAGRNSVEVEGLIGFFVNTLVLRSGLSGDPEFVELLERVRETTLGAYSHQDVPFELVVAELQPERSLNRSPLFQAMFVYQSAPEGELSLPGLQWKPLAWDRRTAKFDLTLGLGPRPDGALDGSLEYNRDLFDPATVERMVGHWVRLLEAVVSAPEKRISQLEMLPRVERRRVVEEWSRTELYTCEAPSAAVLWELQVEQGPDRVAIETAQSVTSYRALDRFANGIAQSLRALGVGPETCVGLCAERGERMVAAILGVWKAGGAWVPMDPAYPAERLAWIAEDAQLSVVLCERSTAEKLPAGSARLVYLEELEPAEGPPQRDTHPGNLAYVIYTSGSTGRPKGVAICHASLAALLAWAGTVFCDDDISAVVAGTSICFDLSLFELFVPLTRGGTVLIVDHILQLPQSLPGRYATLVNTVPSAVPELLRQDGIAPSVRIVNLAGEPLKRELADRIYRLTSAAKVFDLYGPSEDTTYSTWALRSPGGPEIIGRPIANTRLYILDCHGNPAPVGVPGEIYLGGAGLARGYLGRPDFTAERFVPDPFGAEGGSRLYRTGDRGRWSAAGEVEYLGRMDQQVKIRGFRIEPGEIEAMLAQHPHVREAAVVAREGRLVAYVAGGASVEALRRYLSERLPDYMIPGTIVAVEQLPRTPNGKLDRRALPEPESQPREESGPARNAVEAALVAIWSQTLGRETVGIHENFFQLGGDSILSIQIVSRARQAGLRVSVREMFQHQTIAELAAVVEWGAGAEAEQGEVRGPFELTAIQRWFFGQEFADQHHWNQAVLLRVREDCDRRTLEVAWQAVVRHHDGLRQRFALEGGAWRGWQEATDGEVALQWVAVSGREELERIAAERQGSLDLTRGPMVRAVAFELATGGRRLLIVAHHLVVDGVSWRIVLEDLERGCRGEALPAKTTSWRSWANGQKEKAAEKIAVEAWPVEREWGGNRESQAGVVRVSLGEVATKRLLEQGGIQGTLLAALAGALTGYSGGRRVTVEVEGHGREDDVTRTVGWFTTVRAMTLEVEAGEGIWERARRLEEAVRGKAREAGERVGVSFNYLGQFQEEGGGRGYLEWAEESSGAVHSGRAERSYEWEINAAVRGGRLWMEWIYGGERYARESVERAAAEYLRELEEMAAGEVEASYALTPMQQGMLFHMLWEREGGMYYEQMGLELEGELDGRVWREAWQEVVNRHEALRTEVHWQGRERPVQVVKREVRVHVGEEDWRGRSEEENERRLEAELEEERRQGFDLERAPLLRLRTMRRGERRWECVWSHPHLTLDGWAVPIVLEELLAIYGAKRRGEDARLPAAGRYRDYVGWLERQDIGKAEAYWRGRLSGVEAGGRLPGERQRRESSEAGRYGQRVRELSEEATGRIERAAQRERVTVNTLVQGAWSVVMSRHSGRCDVVFGATVSGRPAELAGVERTVGLFLNTLPVRVRVEESEGTGEWLRGLQAQEAEAREYEYASLAQVQGWSGVTPLFESLVVFENYPVGDGGGADGELRLKKVRSWERTNYAQTLVVGPGRRLRLRMGYQEERFSGAGIEGVLEQMERALLAMTEEKVVGRIEILGDEERATLLESGRGKGEKENVESVVALFERQVEARGDAIAVVSEEEAWSYGALNRWANRVAWRLMEQGVGPETRVGLQLERGPGMVAGVLGVLKAGGAYVPMEPGLPAARLQYMREDAGVQVVVRDADLRCAGLPEENPPHRAGMDNLAYLIYTSGSTGQPKAVLITHANLASRTRDMMGRYGIQSADRLPIFISLSFDACAEALYPVLANGGGLIVVPDPSSVSIFSFLEICERMAATALHFSPGYLYRMMRELEAAGRKLPPWARLYIIGGESADPSSVARWRRMNAGARLFNAYGPTETTVTASTNDMTDEGNDTASIGHPFPGSDIYLLDRNLRPVPAGASGELFIGGAGVGRGYGNRPDLTARQFVPHPYSQQAGDRLYRTGDRARLNDRGEFEFLGRSDRQVKIRSFRVELDEIERALAAHADVAEAAVVFSKQSLLAWISLKPGTSAGDLHDFLSRRLPAHMIPQRIERVAALPRTASGKIDYRALPEPSGESTPAAIHRSEPYADILVGLCRKLVGNTLVDAADNFFEMGGDSLLAIQLASRIRTVFDADVSLQSIVESPSLGHLARAIAQAKAADAPRLPEIATAPADQPRPLSFAQESLWRVESAMPKTPGNHVVQALHFEGPLQSEALERALSELLGRHDILRTAIVEVNGMPRQQVSREAELELGLWDLRPIAPELRLEQARLVAQTEACAPFDLRRGPLFRVELLRLDEQEHLLVMSLHHIIADGWSVRTLTAELTACYGAYASGGVPQLAPLRIQFADYAFWERECARKGLFDADLSFWRRQLTGAHYDLQFAPATPGPAQPMGQEFLRISRETSNRLNEWARSEHSTPFIVLCTAWKLLLREHSSTGMVSLCTLVANRTRQETEDVVGLFLNTVILRTDLSGEITFRDAARKVRATAMAAYAHQGLPFEFLLRELTRENGIGRASLSRALFVFENIENAEDDAGGVRITPVVLGQGDAAGAHQPTTFDLVLVAAQDPEGIGFALKYRTGAFEPETIRRHLERLSALIDSAMAAPHHTVAREQAASTY